MTQRFARLENDIVMEVIELQGKDVVQRCFHPEIVAQLVEVPPEIRVAQGMIFLEGAGMFDDPPPLEIQQTKAERLAQSNVKMLHVVDELADIVAQVAVQVGGGVKALSPEAAAILADRRTLTTSR